MQAIVHIFLLNSPVFKSNIHRMEGLTLKNARKQKKTEIKQSKALSVKMLLTRSFLPFYRMSYDQFHAQEKWIFAFSHSYMLEKVLFWNQNFKIEILMYLHNLRSPESENHAFRSWSLYPYVCYYHNSNTNCSRNFKFGNLHFYHM